MGWVSLSSLKGMGAKGMTLTILIMDTLELDKAVWGK